jgi:hypothetical protein
MTRILVVAALVPLASCGGVQERSDDNPVVETVEPNTGPQTGGTEVTLSGSGLDFSDDTPTRVIVGSSIVAATVVDDGTLTFVTPPGVEGLADLVVFNGGGAVPVVQGFTYAPLPTIREVVPDLANPGDQVLVRGSGFQLNNPGELSIDLGATALENISVQSDTVLTGTVPTGSDPPYQRVDVTISTANGSATFERGFRYPGQGLFGIRGRRNLDNSRDELNRGTWFFVDPATAEARFILTSTIPVSKAAVANDGTIIGLIDRLQPKRVGPISVTDFTHTSSNIIADTSRAVDIVVDGADYFEFEGGTTLNRYPLATGTPATLITLTVSISNPACFFRNDANTLSAINLMNGPLNTVNKANGAVVAGAVLNGQVPNEECHSATRIGNQVFLIGWDRNNRLSRLYRLDVASATLTEVGIISEDGEPVPMRGIVPTP